MKASIIVQNLRCGGCANTISTKLASLENIKDISVDIEASKISFSYKNTNDALAVKQKLRDLGYPSVEDNNGYIDKAKSFVSCASGKFLK